jgi:CBS-domain-containing membrane protein
MLAHPLIRLAWCLAGMACGIGGALFLVGPDHTPHLLASLGGTSVFLCGLTRAPAAQPRALLGGHFGSAIAGLACYQILGESLAAYVLAMCLALALMLTTRTLHPPAGANPIILIHAHGDWSVLWYPVLPGLVSLMLVAVVWSRLYPGLTRYPAEPWARSPQKNDWGGWGP